MSTPPFPAYRSRYMPAFTPEEIAALPDKAWAPVIVTTGAIEQHGPHLPVAVDALMGQAWIERLVPRLSTEASCYIAPPITIGKSNEHVGFPGSLFISKHTLRALLFTIARQLATWGFRHLLVLNTHGGNTDVLLYTLAEIEARWNLRTGFLRNSVDYGLPEKERTLGMHANTAETAWVSHLAPDCVDLTAAVAEYPDDSAAAGELRPEAAPATFAWVTADVSRTGIMGDAPAGTAERGRNWLDITAQAYADQVDAICRRNRAELEQK